MSSNTYGASQWEVAREAATGRATHHGGHAPDVSAGPPFGSKNDLWRAVLPGLDVVGEVMIDPAGIAQVRNLDTDKLKRLRVLGLTLLAGRG